MHRLLPPFARLNIFRLLPPTRLRRQLAIIGGLTFGIAGVWLIQQLGDEGLLRLRVSPAVARAVRSFRSANPLPNMELGVQTLFTRMRGYTPPPNSIVILSIDNASMEPVIFEEDIAENPLLAEIGVWPWPRSVHAQALELLMEAGARVVVFDILFSLPSTDTEADLAFARALSKYSDRVVLSAQCENRLDRGQLLLQQTVMPHFWQDNPDLAVGFINVKKESDTAVYELARIHPYNCPLLGRSSRLPSLSEAAAIASGLDAIPNRGEWIYYYGQPNTFPIYSYLDLLVPEVRRKNLQDGAIFRDKIVIVGATADILQDHHLTPWDSMSGPEIQANNLATLLEDRGLRVLPKSWQFLVLIGLGCGGGWLVTRWTTTTKIVLSTAGVVTLWGGIAYLLFLAGWVVPVTVWAGAIVSGIGLFDGVNCAIAERTNRLRLRRTLERYVSAPIAAEIVSQKDDFQQMLKGRNLNVAVLFSDIRGFTTISNQLPPDLLVPQLNRYLGTMVEAITQQQGCVDKFIGDAVMAEFGFPISVGPQQDALNAIKAALAMRKALEQLRQEWQQQGKPLMFNGIGINFGEVVAGNIGSPQRLEYTAIGDAVNVASRVESLTKTLGTDLLVTESVYELVKEAIEVRSRGRHQLRGRSSETELYEVICLKGGSRDLYDRVQTDFANYREQRQSPAELHTSQLDDPSPSGADASIDVTVENV
ncbi:CHASE2 domain-containing protein [Synechococcus sp. PCC 7336]|uniref:CHASE2 domain-containing protein n=1 Tax=Synechococcus sp. PCC 7336 TaxID=195250 RepID=UPI0003458D87|nr:adenylate/guanylate cyclase domain-containing protein [Synechococcus sp. PCC 7336]